MHLIISVRLSVRLNRENWKTNAIHKALQLPGPISLSEIQPLAS